MPDVYYWLGDASETTATIVVRSDTDGELTVTGVTAAPVTVVAANEYGIVNLMVTGLVADTSYPFTLLLAGVPVATGSVRTMPTAEQEWAFGWGSCLYQQRPQVYGYQLVNTHDIRAWFALGDTPYCDESTPATITGQTRWMVSDPLLGSYGGWASGRVTWDKTYEYLQKNPGWEYLTQHTPTYRMPDDHEYGNDWDWTTTNATGFTGLTTQAHVDTCGGYANAAAWSWNKGNPANADAEIGDWKPPSCADLASDHPPKYYRKQIGNVEFFHLDCYAHMDAGAKVGSVNTVCIDNATWNAALGYTYSDPAGAALAKTMLGPYQLNWLLTHLASSTATFKVILSGKHTFKGITASDNHGWDSHTVAGATSFTGYAVERDYIIAFVKKYVAGVMWLTGDIHTASVINDVSGHCAVNSSTLGECTWIDGSGAVPRSPGWQSGYIWSMLGESQVGGYNNTYNTYGVVKVAKNFINPRIYNVNGTLVWQGFLLRGKNYLMPSLEAPNENC